MIWHGLAFRDLKFNLATEQCSNNSKENRIVELTAQIELAGRTKEKLMSEYDRKIFKMQRERDSLQQAYNELLTEKEKAEEMQIIRQNISGQKVNVVPILSTEEIVKAREIVRSVYLDEKIEKYIVDIVFATRQPEAYGLEQLKPMIQFGGSPRASINLALAARAYAFIHRRGYVIPEDVRAVCYDVLRHRIGLTYEAEANNMTTEDVITEVLNAVQVP